MKKLFCAAVVVLTVFLLSSCQISSYAPQITDFEMNAVFRIDENEFECTVKYSGSAVSVTALSSAAAGVSAQYDGKNLSFTLGDMAYTLQNDETLPLNPAVVIYNVLYYIENSENLNADLIDSGYCFTGKISIGSFVMYQSKNGLPQSIEIETAGIDITFSEDT